MDDRYEIRGKIGQGGIGAVYAAFDKNLNRDVAIKRIVPERTADLEIEASRQMAKEAAALCKLQHPNIVTVYDVGVDKDGPFVVMELLQGKTIDEVVAKATFTWADFREFALQTHEALIAAQELDMVHRDLKPTNVMLNWLPSGKFQVKIVDFGLAKFSPKPSLQTIDQKDSIFGSIFFMAPEQFERTELDARTDMYSIGCVFYYALTGTHPFNGDTGPQVMLAHLDHRIFPLHEVRPDLPRWVADWVMWHVNRLPEHRPNSAREALALFIQSEKNIPAPPPEQNQATPSYQAPAGTISPVSANIPKISALHITAPQPILPPNAFGKQSVHADSQPLSPTGEFTNAATSIAAPVTPAQSISSEVTITTDPVVESPAPPPPPQLAPPPAANAESANKPRPRLLMPSTKTADQPQEPVASTPSSAVVEPIATPPPAAQQPSPAALAPAPMMRAAKSATAPAIVSAIPTAAMVTAAPSATPQQRPSAIPQTHPFNKPGPVTAQAVAPATPVTGKKTKANQTNKTILIVALSIIVVVAGIFLISSMSGRKETKQYNLLMEQMKDVTIRELEVNKSDLDLLLSNAVSLSDVKGRETLYKALYIAVSTDGIDIDSYLTKFTTSTTINEGIRANLLRRVIGGRKNPACVIPLIEYSKSTAVKESALAAIEAIREIATEEHLQQILGICLSTDDARIRKACEEAIISISKKSNDKNTLSQSIATAYNTATIAEQKQSLLRILGTTGTDNAKQVILAQFDGKDTIMQIAAADAARNWPNESILMDLITALGRELEPQARKRIFDSCNALLTSSTIQIQDQAKQKFWTELVAKADLAEFQESIINSLVRIPTDWSFALVKSYADKAEADRVIDRAEKAMRNMEDKMKKPKSSDSK
jgi:serine/threonine protein kinase